MPMNDYMLALRERFFTQPECPEARREIERNLQSLRQQMNKEQRKKLLRIIDAEEELQDEISLAGFTAGFRLAWAIAKELETERGE